MIRYSILLSFPLLLSCGQQELSSNSTKELQTENTFSERLEQAFADLALSPSDYERIVAYISGNEFSNDPEGVVAWNVGEDFPSLGIGHFIWFPEGADEIFTESFPKMARYLQSRWPTAEELDIEEQRIFSFAEEFIFEAHGEVRHAPWKTRSEFIAWKQNRAEEFWTLVHFFTHELTESLQVAYLDLDFKESLVELVEAVDSAEDLVAMEAPEGTTIFQAREKIEHRILLLLESKEGATSMLDYVNFKGDGTNPASRYHRVGWGLQQVLFRNGNLRDEPWAEIKSFARAATETLQRRAELSPRDIERDRWIHGWVNRTLGYGFVDQDEEILEMRAERNEDGSLRWPLLHIGSRAIRELFQ